MFRVTCDQSNDAINVTGKDKFSNNNLKDCDYQLLTYQKKYGITK